MNLSELTVLARQLESSDPDDRSALKSHLERAQELRTLLRRDKSPELASCLGAVSQLIEILSGSRASIGRADVKGIACRMLYALGSDLGDMSLGESEPSAAATTEREPAAEAEAPPAAPAQTESPKAALPDPAPAGAAAPDPVKTTAPASTKAAAPVAAEPSPPAVPGAPSPGKADMAFGQMLVELGHVTREQVTAALKFHENRGPRIGECLLLQGAISPDHLLNALKIQDLLRETPEGITPETLARYKKREGGEESKAEANPAAPGEGAPHGAAPITEGTLLGEILLGEKMISNDQLVKALDLHHRTGIRMGEALVKLGALTELDVQSGLRLQKKLREIAGTRVT